MKINFKRKIRDLDNEVIVDEKGEEFDLKRVCIGALLISDESESADRKYKSYLLASKISRKDILDLKSEDITFLKEKVGRNYTALFVGRTYELLENKNQEVEEDQESK